MTHDYHKAVNWLSVKQHAFVEMLIYLGTIFMALSNATGYLV